MWTMEPWAGEKWLWRPFSVGAFPAWLTVWLDKWVAWTAEFACLHLLCCVWLAFPLGGPNVACMQIEGDVKEGPNALL